MSVFFAVSASVLFGSADYMGGSATRHSSPWVVLVYSQVFGILLGIAGALALPGAAMMGRDILFGGLAGLAGAIGLATLYYSLAHTVVSVASPVAAVVGAAVPLVFGLAMGESTTLVGAIGIAVAFVSIVLVSGESGAENVTPSSKEREKESEPGYLRKSRTRRAVAFGALAGIGFGGFFIAISQTGESTGLAPLVVARAVSIFGVVCFQLLRRGSFALARRSRVPALGAGILDMGANIAFLVAVRSGMIMVVTLITSTYPAMTVGLARLVDRERLGVRRTVGLVSAIVAVAMIGASGTS